VKLTKGAIQECSPAPDPHSGFLNKSDFGNLQTQIDGEYGGLAIATLEDGVKVIAPTKTRPPTKPGSSRRLYHPSDGKLISAARWTSKWLRRCAFLARRLSSPSSARRDAPFEFRSPARLDLETRPLEGRNRIGLITITGFSPERNRRADVVSAASSIKNKASPLGYIVDLRSNPGGILGMKLSPCPMPSCPKANRLRT
jgi:carboxyl-terminal processing protease